MKRRNLFFTVCLISLAVLLMIPAYAAPKVTLTIWAVDSIENTANTNTAYVHALVKNFQAKNPDIKIDWVAFGTQGSPLNDKLKIALANNQGPDIFQSWGGSFMGQFADAGKLLDLTKELANVKTSSAAKEAMSWKGKTYGVAPFFAVAGLFVNEGIFKQYGLSVPTTVEELEKVADTLKSKGIQPFAVGAKDQWPVLATYMYLVNRYGGRVFEDAVARKVGFNSEPFVKAATKYQEWAKKGYFGDKPLSEGYGDAQLLMCTGKAAMQISGSWLCGLYSDKTQTDQTIGMYPVPIIKGEKGLVTDVMGMTDVGFAATKIGAKKKDAIVKFMKYAMTVEACSAETGRVSSVPGVKPPTRLTGMAADNILAKAKYVQFWWDQDLPATVSTPINTTIQTFFMPNTDVKRSLNKFEELVVDNMGPIKKK
ncbi:MAG TPA: extracellular solute-binding protein [Bacillota bacterium]|jgi:raffinose/stachyose/melibiose transport system substrate-binding protein|nr:extracellular solute-binding protein [Bacillota bacterium]HOL09268.1 extracellular solute-binding protein [Bacillota bacterium]HPO96931.1 extracellular solute-binding protein [Bacillota bacterium]